MIKAIRVLSGDRVNLSHSTGRRAKMQALMSCKLGNKLWVRYPVSLLYSWPMLFLGAKVTWSISDLCAPIHEGTRSDVEWLSSRPLSLIHI